ncbi:MAG: HD domain-containing protein [Erysipelotrichaceae bacterium]|nr:HD domain-containing protein [Erysipelotrichaceae bacterium]
MMRISEFTKNERIDTNMLIGQVTNGTSSTGAPYLTVTFKDATGTIDGKLWDVKAPQLEVFQSGKVVRVVAEVSDYRGKLQLKIISGEEVSGDAVNLEDFSPRGNVSQDELKGIINEAIESIDSFDLKAIVSAIYRKYSREIFSSPAAARNHHEYYGGLATHVASMVKLADAVCRLYPALDRDLLIAGVLLHDVGKIRELGGLAMTEYTMEGKLLGHISISQTLVQETADELGINSEAVTLLRHMILAHHGEYEYGSPVLPLTIEAEALHYIDDFDARMTMIQKELDRTREGEFTGKVLSLNGRAFYKPHKE